MILFGAKTAKTRMRQKYGAFKDGRLSVRTDGRIDGRTVYDYESIYEYIRGKESFTSKDLRAFTGAGEGSVQGIITTLSLTYPIYEKGYGKYALLKDEDLKWQTVKH